MNFKNKILKVGKDKKDTCGDYDQGKTEGVGQNRRRFFDFIPNTQPYSFIDFG